MTGFEDHTPAPSPEATRRIGLYKASQVTPKRVEWLLEPWIPRRSLTLLAGREGLGKSTAACAIAAQATTGHLDNGQPLNVAYLATEDSVEMTVQPRLHAAGADLDRVYFFQVTTEDGHHGTLTLPGDTALLEAALIDNNVGLVILDAAKSAMHPSLNGYRDDDVRSFLEPLSSLCDKNDIAVIGLVHFGKRESNDSGKLIMGSIAWSQIARSVLSMAVKDDGTLVVTNTKGNLAPRTLSREARIESTPLTIDGAVAEIGRLVWGADTTTSAIELLGTRTDEDGDERSEIEMIVEDYLIHHGGSAPAGDVLKATRAAGLADGSVKNARKKMGIKTKKSGMNGRWMWTIERPTNPEGTSSAPKVTEDHRTNTRVPSVTFNDLRVPSRESSPIRSSFPEGSTGQSGQSGHPYAREGGPTGPTGADQGKQDGPTGRKTQLGHRITHGPTGDPTALEATVLDSLDPDVGQSFRTVCSSVPKKLRDTTNLEPVLEALTQRGLVTFREGRYFKAA
ncbi:AAA family ATPase [Corynebacterium mastitidis]|uniref:AAA family ATPase n=1 Tax=Corynebacterium mastitidis TaxID=161890 RepID=A0A2N0X9F8_9CORY|nr:AAA family ATPase [Corynebacterium mastitidis]PKF69343.1 hypothetical protein CXB45_02380 [Corynebacterium mastitidis]